MNTVISTCCFALIALRPSTRYTFGCYRLYTSKPMYSSRVFARFGKYDVVEEEFREINKVFTNTFGEENPRTINTLEWLAEILLNRGKFKEAEEYAVT